MEHSADMEDDTSEGVEGVSRYLGRHSDLMTIQPSADNYKD